MKRVGPKEGPPLVEKILSIQYDPCRTARIALVATGNNARYIIATSTMKEGDLISTSGHIPRIASKFRWNQLIRVAILKISMKFH